MKVEHMTSSRGNKVPNQFIITDGRGNQFFQSYSVIVAKITSKGNIYIDGRYNNYSVTTNRYLAQFLGLNLKGRNDAIKSGLIKFKRLNK